MSWFFLIIFLIIFYLLYRLMKFWIIDPWMIHRDFWLQGIPGHYRPIVGDVLEIRRAIAADDPFSYHKSMMKRYNDYYHSSFGPIARLIISDPMLIQGVLKTNARCYHKASVMRNILGVLLGDRNLIMAEDFVHSQHRRLIAPVFQHQNLNSMISLMIQITSNYVQRWNSMINNDQSLTMDIQKEMANLTLDIVTSCVFGHGLMNDEHVREVIYRNVTTTLEDVESRTFNLIGIIPIINQLPLPSKKRIDRSKKDVRMVIQNIIEQRKKGLTQSACKGPDLLDLLLSAHGQDKSSQFTDEELFEEALTFVIAGHETTSNLMTWTLLNLCNHPDVCRRLEEEVDSVLHDDDEEWDFSTLSLLNYTELVLKESLRIHQPVPAIVRTTVEDNILTSSDGKEIHLKQGTDLLINIYGLHHSDKFWENLYEFNPLRFTNQRHIDTFLPFSAGPRSCIGQNFAMLEAKIMLAMLIRYFSFELIPGQKHVPEIAITMRPKYGMWMKVKSRHKLNLS